MKIPFTLNGEEIILDAEPDTKLLQLLRDNGFFSVKDGCRQGSCGACTVLLDGKPVPSCIIPSAAVRHTDVQTLEYFMKNPDYADIEAGFRQAGVELCGYCNAGKIFAAWSIISTDPRPSRESVTKAARFFPCRCTDVETLTSGIILAAANRRKRFSEK
ncbi:MAG: 2Fe-2S iron-sulfur cluster binding domain-containing protein [Treponemataceae bacterium]|nr:2Fe-2S iron-sulfur cluster binding domain-containing protein [Treponemataceae bacterium]